MDAQVKISYKISAEEWSRTASLRFREDTFPLFHCFFGHVSFRIGDDEVLGTDHFDMSVADLAVGVTEILEDLRSRASGFLRFQESDDMLEIILRLDGDLIILTHNLAPGKHWECNRGDLEEAITAFVEAFTEEATSKVPDVLAWRDLSILGKDRKNTTDKASR